LQHFAFNLLKTKINVTFTLEQAMKAHRKSMGIALLPFSLGTKWEWVVNATPTPRPLYPQERDPVPIV
jgi:hypothetical protein